MPEKVTQIYISDENKPPEGAIGTYMNAIKAKAEATGCEYTRYNDVMIQRFIEEHYSERVLSAYKNLSPYAYKADLARYCIIHKLGGWYLDAGVEWCYSSFLAGHQAELMAFRDIQKYSGSSWASSNGLFYARSEHPATRKAIDIAVANTEKRYYGLSPLCPTGPSVWGAAIAYAGLSKGVVIGDLLHLTPTHKHLNTSYVLPSGRILARKPHTARVQELGGGESLKNYSECWRLRKVFGETVDTD